MALEVDKFYPFTFRRLFQLIEQEKLKVKPEEKNILRKVQVRDKLGRLYNSPYLWSSESKTNPLHELRLNDNPNATEQGTLILSGHIDDNVTGFQFQLREKFPEGSSSTGAKGGKRRKGTRRRKNKSKRFSIKKGV